MTASASQQVSFWDVHTFVTAFISQAGVTSWPMAGTPMWCALADGDPRKLAALLDAAQHWILRVESAQEARIEASKTIAQAADWSRVAQEARNRAEFEASRPWAKRVSQR